MKGYKCKCGHVHSVGSYRYGTSGGIATAALPCRECDCGTAKGEQSDG